MFDIGFFELLVIGVVLLMVMGPERLPEVARQGATFIKNVRAWIFQMKSEMNLINDPILKELKQAKHQLNDFQRDLRQVGSDFTSSIKDDLKLSDEHDAVDDSTELMKPIKPASKKEIKPVSKTKAAEKKTTKKAASKKKVSKKKVSKTAADKKPVVKKAAAKKVSKKVAKKTAKKTSKRVSKKSST